MQIKDKIGVKLVQEKKKKLIESHDVEETEQTRTFEFCSSFYHLGLTLSFGAGCHLIIWGFSLVILKVGRTE